MIKRIALVIALALFTLGASAQMVVNDLPGRAAISEQVTGFDTALPVSPDGQTVIPADTYMLSQLLSRENKLLGRRRTALIVSLAGIGVEAVGVSLPRQNNGDLTDFGAAMVFVGGTATLVGGVWLLVNEFNLISTRRKINEGMMLQVAPGKISLQF